MRKLKEARQAAGLSQTQLAEAAGVPVRVIRTFEAEAASASRDINRGEALTVWRLARALAVPVDAILEIPDEELEG